MGMRFSTSLQTGPGAYPASYAMGTGYFPGAKQPGRGYTSTPLLSPYGLFLGELYLFTEY